jgi:GNAT superfamily N-acetyltransferase
MTDRCAIERLPLRPVPRDIRALAELLVDAVDSGAAVSFLCTLTVDQAAAWWDKAVAGLQGSGAVLVARDGQGIVGSVMLQPAWAPNQPHRAEVAKLLVHRRCRGAGLGRRLMEAVEDAAREAGFTLLTLDAKRGGVADGLYRKMGWTLAGTIPGFAVDTDGKTLHDAVVFYKHLQR